VTQRQRLFVGGAWVEPDDGHYEVVDPATEQTVGWAPEASRKQVHAAAAAARDAFGPWSRKAPEERAAVLARAADVMQRNLVPYADLARAESGATTGTARGMQVGVAVARFRRYARVEPAERPLPPQINEAGPFGGAAVLGALAVRQPVGVVTCITSYPQRGVYDRLVSRLSGYARHLTVGDPRERATVVGPVIASAHRDRVESYVRLGRKEGARLVAGGERPPCERGFYVAPTLLADCTPDMRVVREEIFGPVVVVVPFDDEEEGVALANDSDYGLIDYVWSGDVARAFRVARRLRVGGVGVNTVGRNMEAPFGGFKRSGVGRDVGSYALHAYSELQAIVWPG